MNHNLAQSPLKLKQTGQTTTHTTTSSNANPVTGTPLLLLQPQLTQQHIFSLPKESYVNMFQEINRYANTINQKYLIDSGGVSTSQLRRKHHFMVMLMSLKYKFQLFITNLLNYKQLANWLEYLSKEKTILKTFYDLPSVTSQPPPPHYYNQSHLLQACKNGGGVDSGMGADNFMSSSNSSLLNTSSTMNNAWVIGVFLFHLFSPRLIFDELE
jgi:hypothetical protein